MPGSHLFHWSSAFTPSGELLPEEQIKRRLGSFGYQEGMMVVIYGTRGIRSAFLAAVLTCAGFSVSNYAGAVHKTKAKISMGFELPNNLVQCLKAQVLTMNLFAHACASHSPCKLHIPIEHIQNAATLHCLCFRSQTFPFWGAACRFVDGMEQTFVSRRYCRPCSIGTSRILRIVLLSSKC